MITTAVRLLPPLSPGQLSECKKRNQKPKQKIRARINVPITLREYQIYRVSFCENNHGCVYVPCQFVMFLKIPKQKNCTIQI